VQNVIDAVTNAYNKKTGRIAQAYIANISEGTNVILH